MKKARTGLSWFRRLFSTKAAFTLPLPVVELLQSGIPVQVQQFPGQGRGLVATRDLEYGEPLFAEQPYLCIPAVSKRKQVCYNCLKVLPCAQQAAASQPAVYTRNHAFCSQDCLASAQASYYSLESQVNLSQLDRYCEAHSERFPLLAARLALMSAQSALALTADDDQAAAAGAGAGAAADADADSRGISRFSSSSNTSSSMGRALNSSSWMSSASNRSSRQAGGIGRLSAASSSLGTTASLGSSGNSQADPSAALSFLCFANVPPPPPAPWQQAHRLMLSALEASGNCREEPQEGEVLKAALEHLDINWYVAVMARLHLNTFKVDALLPMDWNNAYAAAAAMMQEDSSSGSALYLLASLFNHSCEPCVNVSFPNNDGTAVFTAARHISAGEQLFISYSDTEQDVSIRQEYLAFSYGFRCKCPRCQEELAEAHRNAPPQL